MVKFKKVPGPTALSPGLQEHLPPFNPGWYPALFNARVEYLKDRAAEIAEMDPAEAQEALKEFNEVDLELLGLKRMPLEIRK